MHARMLSVVVFSAERLQAAATAAGRSDGCRRIQQNSPRPSSGIFDLDLVHSCTGRILASSGDMHENFEYRYEEF